MLLGVGRKSVTVKDGDVMLSGNATRSAHTLLPILSTELRCEGDLLQLNAQFDLIGQRGMVFN